MCLRVKDEVILIKVKIKILNTTLIIKSWKALRWVMEGLAESCIFRFAQIGTTKRRGHG